MSLELERHVRRATDRVENLCRLLEFGIEEWPFSPDTGIITVEASPAEASLLHAAFQMRAFTGDVPQTFILGAAFRHLFLGGDAFLCAGGRSSVVFDSFAPVNRIVAIPRRIGKVGV